MPRRRTKRPAPGRGVTLAEIRGAYRACKRSHWWIFWLAPDRRGRTQAERRHGYFICACALTLPLEWHHQHEGRLSDAYYRARNDHLRLRRPIYRDPRPTVPEDYRR